MEEDVEKLRAEQVRLWDDFKAREPYISQEAAKAMRHRMDVLRAAIELLTERVPE